MTAPTPRHRRLAHSPVVLRGGQWWLDGGAGSVPAVDPDFTAVLYDFAQAMAAADRAVAALRIRQGKPSASGQGDRR